MRRRATRILCGILCLLLISLCIFSQWWDLRLQFTRRTAMDFYFPGCMVYHFDIDMWDQDHGWEFMRDHQTARIVDYFWFGNPYTPSGSGDFSIYLPWWMMLTPALIVYLAILRLTRRPKPPQGFPVSPDAHAPSVRYTR